jgi:hypothetical protein
MFDISQQVIHETLDGETMIVRLDSGNYYSMNITGGQVWALIEQGASKNEIVSAFAGLYGLDKNIIEEQIEIFLKYLIVEELILPNGAAPEANAAHQSIGIQRLTDSFEAPLLSKYSDMQELLILDPIHDVSDAGWPNPKPENENNG